MSSDSYGGPVDVPVHGSRLRLADKQRLRTAVAAVEVMNDPAKRQLLLRELREELGPEFDPRRFGAVGTDSWEITSACIRLGAIRELVEVLRLVGGGSKALDALTDLVKEVFPPSVLRAADRRRIEQLLRRVRIDILAQALRTIPGFAEGDLRLESADDHRTILDGLERRAATRSNDRSLWLFLEYVGHHCGNDEISEKLHLVVNAAAGLLGERVYSTVRQICDDLRDTERGNGEIAPQPSDEHVPETGDTVVLLPVTDSGDDVSTGALAALVSMGVPASVPAVWGGVPPRNGFFAGRSDTLDAIKRTLRSNVRAAVLPHTLHGLGGVGKSQVAIEFAYRFRSEYDLVWWILADDERSIRRSIVSLARKLGLPEADDQQFMIDSALDELRIGRAHPRWLVVFDNATEPEVVRKYLPAGTGHVLITSRSRSWVGFSRVVEVDVFRPEESVEFLSSRWEGLTEEDALRLADRLGHLPLALDQAVAVHEQTGMPLAEYLRIFEASPVQMLNEVAPTEYPMPVARTWRLAFDELRERSPAAALLLQLCAFLSSHPISVPMLREGRGAALPSPLDVTMRDELKFRKAVQDISKYALAQLDPGRDFITIHMLVRAVLRDGLEQDERERTERAAHEVLALANHGSPDRNDTWSRHAQIAPHVIPSGVIHSSDAHARQIAIDQIRYYFAIGDFAASKSLAQQVVEDWHGRLGPDDLMTMRASFHLGNALRVLGEYAQAREVTQDTFHRFERKFGPDHEHTLQVANSFTADLRLRGEFDRARELDEENLRRHRRALGDDDPSTMRAVNNLAIDYRLAGRFAEAKKLDEENVRISMLADPGGRNPETLLFVNNLVCDLYGLGHYAEALRLQVERLAAFEDRLRPGHRMILIGRRNVAVLLRKTGDVARALRQAEAGFEATRAQLGSSHEYSLAAATTLFNTLRAANQELDRAGELAEQTYGHYRERFGRDHPASLACAVNLAIVHRARGHQAKATELDAETLAALRRVLGEDHPYTLCCAANTTNNLAYAGRTQESRALSHEVLARSRRVRGEEHPYTLACAANLALDLDAVGEHAETSLLRDETLHQMQLRLGPEHPQTVSVERRRRRRTEADIEIVPM